VSVSLSPTLPASSYSGSEAFARDRETIIGSEWWVVAHLQELPEPGDVVRFTIAGWDLLAVRQDDRGVKIFHNTCRHRFGPLVWEEERPRGLSHLQCRYHGWCYRRDGSLLATPQFGSPVKGRGLIEVPVHVWRGLIFAVPQGSEQSSPPPVVRALEALFSDLDLAGWEVERRATHRLACDWKVYVENYLEGYHIPWVHPGLAREVSLREYAVKLHDDGVVVTHHVGPRTPDAVNSGRWAWAWPGLAVNVYASGVCIERMVPEEVGVTRVDYLYLFPGSVSDEARSRAMEMSAEVTAEDVRIVEAVQRNLMAAGGATGVLSPRHEAGVAAFQRRVRNAWDRC